MKAATARAYLDGLPAAIFNSLVVPHLEVRRFGRHLRYTRASIDSWIEGGEAQTPEQLARLLDKDR
jgi:hypothetical protein